MHKIANFYKKKLKGSGRAAGSQDTLSSHHQTTNTASSSPSHTLDYKRLDPSTSEIRLLTFLPHNNSNGPIHLELSHYPLTQPDHSTALKSKLRSFGGEYFWDTNNTSKDKPNFQIKPLTSSARKKDALIPGRFPWGDYVALSYTWGDPYDTRSIIVNKVSVPVTKNLEMALRILREKMPVRAGMKVWVDAVCVNQADNKEKSEQVPRMREIYKKAFDVVIWLGNDDENGQPDEESWKAMTLIRLLAASWRHDEGKYLKQSFAEEEDFSLDMLFPPGRPSISGCWHALRTLLRRPYWNRAWIIQEIFMGDRESPVLCGHEMVQFGELSDATTQWLSYSNMHLVRREMINERLLQGSIKRSTRDPNQPLQSQTFREAALELGGLPFDPVLREAGVDIYNSTSISSWALDSERISFMRRLRSSLGDEMDAHPVNTVALGRLSDATKQHDKIYAFLGLMDPGFSSQITPDYEKPYGEVYTDFSITWLMQLQNHNILTHCIYAEDQDFPSWVPDWSKTVLRTLLPIGEVSNPYDAGGDTMADTNISPDYKIMTTLGLIFDTIDSLSTNSEDNNPTPFTQPTSETPSPYSSPRDVLWRTLLGNRDFQFKLPDPDNGYGGEFRALLDIPLPSLGGHLPAPYDSSFYTFIKQNDSFLFAGKRLDHYFANDGRREPVSTDDASRALFQRVLGDSVARASMMINDRLLFTTKEGYIGLAPEESRKGDVVCVLVGCGEPLVLRWDERREACKVIGSCYLHGIMEGELKTAILAGSVPLSPISLC